MPERIRTFDPQSRSLILYPAELRAQVLSCQILACNHRSRSLILYPAELRAQTICNFRMKTRDLAGDFPAETRSRLYHRFLFVAIGDRLADGRDGHELEPLNLRRFGGFRQQNRIIPQPHALVESRLDAA